MFTSTFTVIYGKIVAATFGREAADRLRSALGRRTRDREREREGEEREGKGRTATFKRAGCAAKNSKGFDHLSRHGRYPRERRGVGNAIGRTD